MNFDIENELRPLLTKDERLLWTGRPSADILFRWSDIFLIPFSVLWCGFAIFWVYTAQKMSGIFAMFGLPFIFVGLYFVIGRFFLDAYKRKKTLYGITDNRIIIKSGIFSPEIKSLNIMTISDLTCKEKKDGSGVILLGPSDFRYSMFSGMGYWPGLNLPPSLELTGEARNVYNLIVGIQQKKKMRTLVTRYKTPLSKQKNGSP